MHVCASERCASRRGLFRFLNVPTWNVSTLLWWRFVAFAFQQLYTRFAWAYDAVAWVVSRGRWQAWGRAAIPRLVGQQVLEIACGPGHLLLAMAQAGYQVSAIDLSPQMAARAHGRLRGQGLSPQVVLGRAQALPWPSASFDTVVMTFPAGFIRHAETLREVQRVLRPGGRLVIVDGARLHGGLYATVVNFAFRLTGGGGSLRSLALRFQQAGFRMRRETVRWPDSSVEVLVLEKTSGPLSAP